jgi:hypothetical protein
MTETDTPTYEDSTLCRQTVLRQDGMDHDYIADLLADVGIPGPANALLNGLSSEARALANASFNGVLSEESELTFKVRQRTFTPDDGAEGIIRVRVQELDPNPLADPRLPCIDILFS